jgi:glycosyltransferase involved in cell wall biosynthesis
VEIAERNVGVARAVGVQEVLAQGADWLAFTDADCEVGPEWLVAQRALNSDVVCGTIEIKDWSHYGEHAAMLAKHFSLTYTDADNHRHVHGANLGMSAAIYQKTHGFQPITAHEDVTLIAELERLNAHIAWSASPRVITSARKGSKTSLGFGNTLCAVVDYYDVMGTTEGFVPPSEA